ncbi:hypothetical protein B0H13DRAFT_1911361 [Mycena leptocephala]|nr:hypothetical protein B0H13DRAFT_1911361 [Mycena leptocephala]
MSLNSSCTKTTIAESEGVSNGGKSIKYTRAFLKPYHVLLKPSCPQLTDRRAICTTTAAHACGVYQLSEEKDESRPQTQTPAWAGQPMPPSNHFSRGPGTAPPLPYTGPPPFNQPPRFSGSQYPDLSLYGSSQPSNPSPYYPAHANPALANQGTQAYQYGANSGPPPTQPGAQQPGSGGYPTGYGQMPYYGQTPMPGYGWPPQQGSSSTNLFVDQRWWSLALASPPEFFVSVVRGWCSHRPPADQCFNVKENADTV